MPQRTCSTCVFRHEGPRRRVVAGHGKAFNVALSLAISSAILLQFRSFLDLHDASRGSAAEEDRLVRPRREEGEGGARGDDRTLAGVVPPRDDVDEAERSLPVDIAATSPRRRSTADACNDTALYYNINTGTWGAFSKSRSPVSVRSARNDSDAVWLIANWIGLPAKKDELKCRGNILESIREQQMLARYASVRLLITDSSDQGSGFQYRRVPLNTCLGEASKLLGAENVYLAARHLVEGRNLACFGMERPKLRCRASTSLGEVNGTVLDYRNTTVSKYIHDGVVAKWDFCVSEEYLPLFDRVANASSDDDRYGDVAHLWAETNQMYGRFRDRVTERVAAIISHHNLTGTAGLVSERGRVGRTSTSRSYANALMGHKIVVVAQRDQWEDHLRLYESLAGGAMVMSDPITHPPPGLADGVNVVYYQSLNDMTEKILYYLNDERGREERRRIARAGRRLALEQYRWHHRYERLMLGDNWPRDWRDPVAPLLNCE